MFIIKTFTDFVLHRVDNLTVDGSVSLIYKMSRQVKRVHQA